MVAIKAFDDGAWQAVGGGGATTLDGLTDVNVPTPGTGNVLTWDGSQWVDDPVTLTGTLPIANGGTGATTAANALTALGAAAASHTHTSSQITDFAEAVDDEVNTLIVAGTGITKTYDDVANTLTLSASGGTINPRQQVRLFADFTLQTTGAATFSDFAIATAGGSVDTQNVNAEANRPGILNATTSTSASGRSEVRTSAVALLLGGGQAAYETALRIPTLSDGTERYVIRAGFIEGGTSARPVDGVWLEYDDSTSPNWIMCASSNSTVTATTSSSAVPANTWQRLGVTVNAAGTSAEFFVDGTSIGTVTTNIPTGTGRNTGAGAVIAKSIGTTSRAMHVDYVLVDITFTTAR